MSNQYATKLSISSFTYWLHSSGNFIVLGLVSGPNTISGLITAIRGVGVRARLGEPHEGTLTDFRMILSNEFPTKTIRVAKAVLCDRHDGAIILSPDPFESEAEIFATFGDRLRIVQWPFTIDGVAQWEDKEVYA